MKWLKLILNLKIGEIIFHNWLYLRNNILLMDFLFNYKYSRVDDILFSCSKWKILWSNNILCVPECIWSLSEGQWGWMVFCHRVHTGATVSVIIQNTPWGVPVGSFPACCVLLLCQHWKQSRSPSSGCGTMCYIGMEREIGMHLKTNK